MWIITLIFIMTQNHFDIIVVGGGIAGSASALGLAQLGYSVAHVNPKPTTTHPNDTWDSRIYALSQSSVALLKRLHVWDALDTSRICPVSDMRVMGDINDDDVLRGSLHLSAYSSALPELAWIVEQRHIQTILDQALRFTPNVQRVDATATELVITDSEVRLSTSNEALQASLVIGADGANSWVRQSLGIETEVFDYQHFGVVANFSISQPHHNTAYQWFLSDGEVLALLPLPNQMVSMVYSCTEAHADIWCNAPSDALSAHIGQLSSHTLGSLTAQSRAQSFPLKRQRAQHLVSQRALLISDAAHTMHPLAGQGLNLGLQDLTSLLDTLLESQASEPHRSIDDPVLLRRYERACATPTFEMQSVTHALQRLFASHHPIIRHARNMGMNVLDVIPPLKRRLIQQAMGHAPTELK